MYLEALMPTTAISIWWDTDQFPLDLTAYTHVLYLLLQKGGFKSGGFNFDAKVRRQTIDLQDLFSGHRMASKPCPRLYLQAAELIKKKQIQDFTKSRYKSWNGKLGQRILKGEMSFESLAKYVEEKGIDPKPQSGRQEMLEGLFNDL